jgi:hypothetical protein
MERQSNNNNPFGIWQSIWADQIKLFNEQMINAVTSLQPHTNYILAYTALQALNVEIPEECQQDAKKQFQEVIRIFTKPKSGPNFVIQEKNKRKQIVCESSTFLWSTMGTIIKSLHARGWINKPDFSARPRNTEEAHIG